MTLREYHKFTLGTTDHLTRCRVLWGGGEIMNDCFSRLGDIGQNIKIRSARYDEKHDVLTAYASDKGFIGSIEKGDITNMTTRNKAAFKVCHVYVYRSNKDAWCASSCLYVDPREIRKFYECIRTCTAGAAECVLTETQDGFRIEVYK